MGELRSGMSGGGAGNRQEVGEVAVVAGGGVGIGERRPRNRRPVGARWEAGSTDESNGLPSRCSLYAGGLKPMGRLLLSPVRVRLAGTESYLDPGVHISILYILLHPLQIISLSKNLGESKFFKFDQIYIIR